MAKKKTTTAATKAALLAKTKRRGVDPKDLLKTGSTVLDLALSGTRAGGFPKGKYIWVVGDSSSGKTWLTLTCMAEATLNPEFKDYRLIYDNVEDGALMDFARYYGQAMADKVEPPAWGTYKKATGGRLVFAADPAKTPTNPAMSLRSEDFYANLDDALKRAEDKGEQFIYVLDSMDALDSKYAQTKFQEAKRETRGGAKAKGDYGDGKAKLNSTHLRGMVNRLSETNSILIVLSQTRDNIDAGMFDPKQTSAGGRALRFYATVQLWSSVGGAIKKQVAGKDVKVGINCRVQVKKNRLTGRDTTVEFPILYDTGIDDIGGMVDFLVTWKYWTKNDQGLIDVSRDFDRDKLKREPLIQWLDVNDLRDDLEDIVADAWVDLMAKVKMERKSKYV